MYALVYIFNISPLNVIYHPALTQILNRNHKLILVTVSIIVLSVWTLQLKCHLVSDNFVRSWLCYPPFLNRNLEDYFRIKE